MFSSLLWAQYILDKITEYCMRSRRSSKRKLAEALAAIAVILSFEFAAPAIALAVGTIGVGDIIAAATFASGLTQGLGFWSYVGGLWLHVLLNSCTGLA